MTDEQVVDALLDADLRKAENGETTVSKPDNEERKTSRKKRSRSRSKSRSRDRRKRRRRSSSRSRDRRRRRRRSRSRDRSRDRRDRRRRRRSRSRSRDRDRRRRRHRSPSRERKRSRRASPKEEKIGEGERDSRTVFSYNLPLKANDKDVKEFFEKAGGVRDVKLIKDRNTRKSKGFGYIEFKQREAVKKALGLSGTQFMGKTVMVQASQAEKNRASSNTTTAGPSRLYVGNLHNDIREEDVKHIFSSFGEIEIVSMPRDDSGVTKGHAYVQFRNPNSAKRALAEVNGLELAGRILKVNLVNENSGTVIGDLDDENDTVGGEAGVSRQALMQKLVASQGGSSQSLVPTSSNPTRCILVTNMFDPAEEEGDFVEEITDAVEEECSKYGPIGHIFVDKDSKGFVYIKFALEEAAVPAVNQLNGRWFSKKMLSANYLDAAAYDKHFRL